MTRDDLERLIWERLDGSITAEDAARLDDILATDAGAEKRYVELERLSGGLADLAHVTPPAELRPRIDRALASVAPPGRRRRAAVGSWSMRFAYLAAGIMLGLVAARLLIPSATVDRRVVAGAMTTPAMAVSVSLAEAGNLSFWRTKPSLTVVDLDLSDSSPVEITLNAELGALTLSRASFGGLTRGEAAVEGGGVRIEGSGTGQSRVVVESEDVASALSFRVTSRGRVLTEGVVHPDELGDD